MTKHKSRNPPKRRRKPNRTQNAGLKPARKRRRRGTRRNPQAELERLARTPQATRKMPTKQKTKYIKKTIEKLPEVVAETTNSTPTIANDLTNFIDKTLMPALAQGAESLWEFMKEEGFTILSTAVAALL
jgi:FtsZ-interacting cell division protein ZipA